MNKLLVTLLIGGIALVGAGCNNNNTQDDQPKPDDTSKTNTNTPATSTYNSTSTDDNTSTTVKSYTVTARNYSFSPEDIRVKKGDKVRITLKTVQGTHTFNIDQLNVKIPTTTAGQTNTVEFTVNKTGIFPFYCASDKQKGMVGELIVQ